MKRDWPMRKGVAPGPSKKKKTKSMSTIGPLKDKENF